MGREGRETQKSKEEKGKNTWREGKGRTEIRQRLIQLHHGDEIQSKSHTALKSLAVWMECISVV